jgi:hypothetical protein
VLGLFWKIGLDPIIIGKLIIKLLGAGCLIFLYLIVKKTFDVNTALIVSFIFGFSQTFFFLNELILTDVPALFFVLAGTYFFLSKNFRISGLFLGLAFMTRIFFILASVPFFIYLLIPIIKKQHRWNDFAYFSIFFLLPIIPYLLINLALYGNIFYPIYAEYFMLRYTGWVWFLPFYYYFLGIFKENILTIFALFGIYKIIKEKDKQKLFLLFTFLIIFIPFILLKEKDMRLILIIWPFIYIFTIYGITAILTSLKNKGFEKYNKWIVVILVLICAINVIPNLKHLHYKDNYDIFYNYSKNNDLGTEIWTSGPNYIVYTDYKAEPIYYPRFDNAKIGGLRKKAPKPSTILLNECDIPCPPDEIGCVKEKERFISELKKEYKVAAHEQIQGCNMLILRSD